MGKVAKHVSRFPYKVDVNTKHVNRTLTLYRWLNANIGAHTQDWIVSGIGQNKIVIGLTRKKDITIVALRWS